MKALSLLAAVSIVSFSAGAQASNRSLVVGQSAAETCFRMALALDHSRDAIGVCDTALDQSLSFDDRVGTFVNRGIVYMLSDDSVAATTDFDRALTLNPNQPEAWLNKGVNQLKLGDGNSAIEFANRALALRTERPAIAYYVRGLANERIGDVRQAYNDLRHAQSLDPAWEAPTYQLTRYRVVR